MNKSKLNKAPQNFTIENPVSGYVLILMTALIPMLLFGTKYLLDLRTASKVHMEKENWKWQKRCAKKAALAVAENWNPGLTLVKQKEAVYKVADAIYNASPIGNGSVISRAIPGLDLKQSQITRGESEVDPLRVSYNYDVEVPDKRIDYETISYSVWKERVRGGCGTRWNPNYLLWTRVDNATQESLRRSIHDEVTCTDYKYKLNHKDFYELLMVKTVGPTYDLYNGKYYLNDDEERVIDVYTNWNYSATQNLCGWQCVYNTLNRSYKKRIDPLEGDPEAPVVKISIENDKIKVQTDNDIAYAEPAKCNVDIVLAVPVNGAANNVNNRDSRSDTPETPVSGTFDSFPDSFKNTSIHQIGQGCKNFAKAFYHIRGVNMSLIPYSGKISIPSNRSSWAISIPKFVWPDNHTIVPQFMISACLYGTKGVKGVNLEQQSDNWGTNLTGYPIMCRQGVRVPLEQYGGNHPASGLLLDTTNPTTSDVYKYMRMNLNPCCGGCANLLSMKCEKQCTYYLPNPYYIIEPTADMVKMYEMCNALYPIYDTYNVSNFIFTAFEWANNLFQSWTRNPSRNAKDGESADATLSIPSKMAENRKKALILVVNKPDWFEPGELTYLGFDNDYSEIPMIESDCIRGDIDYSDTTKYFADGTKYDGTVQGAKKILKLTGFTRNATTGHYECDSGVATLTFPQKYLVKVVVEGKITWTNAGRQYEHPENNARWGNIAWDGTKFLTGTSDSSGKVITSTDGETWTATPITHTRNPTNPEIDMVVRPAYGDGMWQAIGRGTSSGLNSASYSYVSYDGIDWIQIATSWACDAQAYGNGGFMHFGLASSTRCKAYWLDPSDTTKVLTNGDFSKIENNHHRALGFCNGKWCAITWDGRFITSYDNGVTWAVESLSGASPGEVTGTQTEWYGPIYGFGRYWAICRGDGNGTNSSNNYGNTGINCSRIVFSRDGKIWYKDNAALGTLCGTTRWFRGLGFNGKRFVSASDDGYFAYGDCNATIRFTNITSNETHCTQAGKEYKVTEKKEFFIEPDQISDPQTEGGEYSITFDATNLRLISAEITNRPYTRVTPTVSKSGNSFVLNAKVPFVVPLRVTGSNATLTYANEANVSVTQRFLHSQSFQITPETHRYEKTFDVNNDCPSYKVTLTPTNLTIGLPQVGTIEVKKASKTGLSLDSKTPSNGSFSDDDGVTFGYETTKLPDEEDNATVVHNNGTGTITCPTGAVLHVKAVPHGSVKFYNPNDLGETDITGANIAPGVTASSGQAIPITGKQTFTFPASCFAKKYVKDCSKQNSTITFSTEKLKFSLENANILFVVLRDQMLRIRGPRVPYKFIDYRDPSFIIPLEYNSGYIYNDWEVLTDTSHYCRFKMQKPNWLTNVSIRGYGVHYNGTCGQITYYDVNGTSASQKAFTEAGERITATIPSDNSPFLSFAVTVNNNTFYSIRWLQVTNLDDCIMNMDNTADSTTGLWIPAETPDIINFEGQGDLDVIVASLPGTIKFGDSEHRCPNENETKHELYKEYNFCLEPSQMINNEDGTQSVTFSTTGDVTVTATYEIKQKTKVTVTKPNNVAFATINVTGHKKEMEWKKSASQVIGYSNKGDGFRFDGTIVYRYDSQAQNNHHVNYSDDFGVTWKSSAINLTNWISIGDLPNAISFKRPYANMCLSYDDGQHYITRNNVLPYDGDGAGGFKWSRNADAKVKYMLIYNDGRVAVSDDGFTWTNGETLPDSSKYYYNGAYHVNGTWWTVNTSGYVYNFDNDNNIWNKIPLDSSAIGMNWAITNTVSGLAYGSNLMMLVSVNGCIVATSRNKFETVNWRHGGNINLNLENLRDVCYVNGNFIVGQRGNSIAYTTFHDGVMWRENSNNSGAKEKIGISQDIDQNISAVINTEEYSNTVYGTNMTITDISVTYDKVAPLNPSMVIEFKKIRLPENSQYIDYSTDPYTTYVAKGRSDNSFFNTSNNGWYYDEKRGFYVNSSSAGYHTQIYFDIHGDYNSLTYSDDKYEIAHLSADGWLTYDKKKAKQYHTSGLSRTYTLFENFVNGLSNGSGYNWNDYNNGAPGSISLMMQTVTLPINAVLWAGADGDSLHEHHWQGDGSGNLIYDKDENGKWILRDATSALKLVTKDAYVKLKSNWGNNLRVYIIKYRKQTQYKHPVTGEPVEFDYSYLDSCASGTSAPYMYDITETDPTAAKTKLNEALAAIAADIKKWAKYKEAENVD